MIKMWSKAKGQLRYFMHHINHCIYQEGSKNKQQANNHTEEDGGIGGGEGGGGRGGGWGWGRTWFMTLTAAYSRKAPKPTTDKRPSRGGVPGWGGGGQRVGGGGGWGCLTYLIHDINCCIFQESPKNKQQTNHHPYINSFNIAHLKKNKKFKINDQKFAAKLWSIHKNYGNPI